MTWQLTPAVADILSKAEDGVSIGREEALVLMAVPPRSREAHALMHTADHLSRTRFGNKGENHFHIGINVSPCPFDCRFCSLTHGAGIFTQEIEFSEKKILSWARSAEAAAPDALNVMTTGTYSFERLLDIGRLLKKTVRTALVANTRDLSHADGESLLDAGFVGAYHSVRLGEGRDTPFSPQKRIRTIQVLRDVGLRWMNCVEPVGPEHSHGEIVDLMLLAREHGATYSGIMRRINFPGSPMTPHGMITELEMAHMLAVSRLVMGDTVKAHCVHEPNAISLMAGGNLFFPEVGASPRDGEADTARGRGHDLASCQAMQREMGWEPSLASNCF